MFLFLIALGFFSSIYSAARDLISPQTNGMTRSASFSSSLLEGSPRDELEFRITKSATHIVRQKLLKIIENKKGNGLDSALEKILDDAEATYSNDVLMQEPRNLLRMIITTNPAVYEARNKALEFTHTPPETLDIRIGAWSLFKFLVIQKLNEALKESIPHMSPAEGDLGLYYIGQGMFKPEGAQQYMLRKYVIAFTYLLSKHELKDPGSFYEEYKKLLPRYSLQEKEKRKCIVQ